VKVESVQISVYTQGDSPADQAFITIRYHSVHIPWESSSLELPTWNNVSCTLIGPPPQPNGYVPNSNGITLIAFLKISDNQPNFYCNCRLQLPAP
jgi:hypothetical protein